MILEIWGLREPMRTILRFKYPTKSSRVIFPGSMTIFRIPLFVLGKNLKQMSSHTPHQIGEKKTNKQTKTILQDDRQNHIKVMSPNPYEP